MPCPGCVKKITTMLQCVSCGVEMPVRHKEETEPIEFAKLTGRVCNGCQGTEFILCS